MLWLAVLVPGCKASSREKDRVAVTVADSAGIRVVDFAKLPTDSGVLRLSRRPYLTLGGAHDDDRLEFDARAVFLSVALLADGQIAVGDHHRLKYFDTEGQLLRVSGRDGYGPGEFSNIRDLCPLSDSSLMVLDDDGRWSVWDRYGTLSHAQTRLGLVPPNGCSESGAVIVRQSSVESSTPANDAAARRTLPYALYRADGTLLQQLGRLAVPEYFGPIFFEPSFAIVDDQLLIGEPQRFEIRTQSLATGQTTHVWRVHGATSVLTDDAWDTLITSGFPSDATPEQRKKHISRMKQFEKPHTYPAFWRVRADPRGRIWINPYLDHMHWYVIDDSRTQMLLVRLPLPESRRPQLVGFAGESVVIRHVDETGAAQLSFYHMETR